MKKILFISLLITFISSIKAQENIYFFGVPLGLTTYEELNQILEANEYKLSGTVDTVAVYQGVYADFAANIYLFYRDEYVYKSLININNLSMNTAFKLFDDLLKTFQEDYKNYHYGSISEDEQIMCSFMNDAGAIALEVKAQSDGLNMISIFYSCNKDENELIKDRLLLDEELSEGRLPLSPKDIGDGDWVVSDEIESETGKTGSYWHSKMKILRFNDGRYALSIFKPANNGYYKIYADENLYIKLDNDSIIALKLNTELSPWNYVREGYLANGIYWKTRYYTQTFYDIEDINQLLNHNVVKVRWIIDEKPYDIDYEQNKYTKKFNKQLHEAILQAKKKGETKENFEKDNLSGF